MRRVPLNYREEYANKPECRNLYAQPDQQQATALGETWNRIRLQKIGKKLRQQAKQAKKERKAAQKKS